MHSNFTYSNEVARADTEAWLSGAPSRPKHKRHPSHGATRCFLGGQYIGPGEYRRALIQTGVVRPDTQTGVLRIDDVGKAEAEAEIGNMHEFGAYADRGLRVSNGRIERAQSGFDQ